MAALAAPALAAEGVPDPASQREFSAKLKACTLCHGENGTTKGETIPVIAGQQEEYVVKQLHDFHDGKRNVEVMKWMAETLAPEEVPAAAAYFSKRNWPAKQTAAAAPLPRGMVACQACHQLNFGGGQVVPRLAGQRYEYLVQEMARFANGERNNSADMTQIMKSVSAADREAMARYLSGL